MTNRFLLMCFWGALVMVVAVTTTTPHSYGQNRLGVQMGDPPANPRASADARAVLAYLQAQRTNCAILAGQNVKSGEGMAEDYAEVVVGLHATTGQWVGLLGMDYYDYDDDHADYAESNPILIDYWQAGGLVSLSWSIPNPWTGGNAWDTRNADLTELLDPNAPAHGVWMAHLDNMADALTALRNAGVVVLWRPLHEMNEDWFWWGSGSHPGTPAPYQALWRQMFDYFTVTRGLDNLLWVYSAAGEEPLDTRPAADFYYPGNAYVDVVGQSVYSGTLDQFHIYSYDRLLSLGKPVALAEFGPGLTWMGPQDGDYDYLILLERLRNRYPQTVYWLSWHDWAEDGVPVYMSIAKNLNATALMNDSCVTTRDEVDWHSYLAPTPTRTPTPPSSGAATVFYTEQPPTVDGQLDSLWASAVPYTIGKSILGKMPTQTDLSASFKALYDKDTFYLFVDIPDDLLVQDSVSQWWEDDAVEIYLDGNLSRGQTYDGVDDYLLILRWNDATVYVGADSVPAPADLEWAYRQTDSGWAVEIAFPWSALGITAQPGIQFGHDVHVSDDDDGGDAREHKLAWHADRDDAWYNPSLLGLAELADTRFTVNLPLVLTHTAQATPAIPVPPTSTPTPEAPQTFETLEPQSMGATYYVSGTGNDDNAGLSAQQPFRTLQRAANLTQPGDTVLVMNGVYTAPGAGATVLSITTAGTADNWIQYKAYPGHQPHIQIEEHWAGILVGGASYILIEGFTVEGNAPNVTLEYALQEMSNLNNPITSGSGIAIRESFADPSKHPHHVIVRNNHVFHCPGGGIESLHADYLRIEDNLVHHNAFYTPYANSGITNYLNSNSDDSTATKMIVRRNISFKNENKVPHYYSNPDDPDARVITDGNGIIVDDTRNIQSEVPKARYTGRTLVENNLVYDNGGRGILVYLSDNVVVRNNTSYRNARTPIMSAEVAVNDASDVEIYGNIIAPRPDRLSVDTALLNQVSFRQNLYYGGTGNPSQTPSDVVADPEFVRASIEPTLADFRLQASSPAIDRLAMPHADVDLKKTPRPRGAAADLGAYER